MYEAGEGWQRLCEFLGVPVPEEPFPRLNTREEFEQRWRDRVDEPPEEAGRST